MSADARPISGRNVNSHWLGPSSTSSDRSGMPSAMTARQNGSRIGSIWSERASVRSWKP